MGPGIQPCRDPEILESMTLILIRIDTPKMRQHRIPANGKPLGPKALRPMCIADPNLIQYRMGLLGSCAQTHQQ